MPLVRVKETTRAALMELAGAMQKELKRKVSIDEVIVESLKFVDQNTPTLSLQDSPLRRPSRQDTR